MAKLKIIIISMMVLITGPEEYRIARAGEPDSGRQHSAEGIINDTVPFLLFNFSNDEGFRAFLAGDTNFNHFADTYSYTKDLNNDGFIDTVFSTQFKMSRRSRKALNRNSRIVNGKTKEVYSLNYSWNDYDIVSFSPLNDNLTKEDNAPFLDEICKNIAFDGHDRYYYKRQHADPSLKWVLLNYGFSDEQKNVKLKQAWSDSSSKEQRSYYIIMDTGELKKYGINTSKLMGENAQAHSKFVLFYNKSFLYHYEIEYAPLGNTGVYTPVYKYESPRSAFIGKDFTVYKTKGSIYIKNNKGVSYLFVINRTPLQHSRLFDIEVKGKHLYFKHGFDDLSYRPCRMDMNTRVIELFEIECC